MAPLSSPILPLEVTIPPALAAHLKKDHSIFWGNFERYCAEGIANPHFQTPLTGHWISYIRTPKRRSAAKQQAFQGVQGFQTHPRASRLALFWAYLVRYGREHGHTRPPQTEITPEGFLLGSAVKGKRQAQKETGQGDHKWDPQTRPFYEKCIPNWAWGLPPGYKGNAGRKSILREEPTAEHRWWHHWAEAYLYRYNGIALTLQTPETLKNALGAETWAWLALLLEDPRATMEQWPLETRLVRERALAMLELVPYQGCQPEWLPEGSIGQALLGNRALLRVAKHLYT